ncbi:hypothetical protein [Streptomyces justiciae]|uniref:Uncharacterized protein n=1 Tax=Streptomyces justiciae TaxID=2780140 RepID=A0ABU3M4I1_9ACTN|nr:hypothetical protein [Streptomyces justiciae]MDT7845643.1 hypothetical protein [Streptomyces justiciae]
MLQENTENRDDLLATVLSLTAEAAALEGRIQMLREELAAVDARTGAITESLRRLAPFDADTSADSAKAEEGRLRFAHGRRRVDIASRGCGRPATGRR